jgi:hypothetical protein
MDQDDRDRLLQNLEDRLGKVEQILPTLATREDLMPLATRAELAPLATREDLIPLATRAEMYAAIKAEGEQTRRHMDILTEALHDDIRIVAEGQVALRQRVSTLETSHDGNIAALDTRVSSLETWRRAQSL